MAPRRAVYLPITFIVIGILILGTAVAVVSFRDIERGRTQVAEILRRQAGGAIMILGADLRAELVAPAWQRSRLERFFQDVTDRENVVYMAILDADGRVLVHSDPEKVGTTWPGPVGPARRGRRPEPTVVTVDGRRIHQFAAPLELHPERLCMPGRFGRGPVGCLMDPEAVSQRLAEFLHRPVSPGSIVELTAVVGLDASELESGFLAARNHTMMLSALLLLVGAVGIYFLFAAAHYRSVRTALANMRSYTANLIESMPSGLVSVGPDGRVVTVNSRARAMLSLSGDAGGRKLDDVVCIETPSECAAVGDVVAGRTGVLETQTRIRAGGVSIPVELSASAVRDEDGGRAGAVILFQDLREIEALKEAVEREKHLASLGRLAAGVAHEVRNPLSSLKGFAQLFRTKFEPGSQEERHADIMIEEVERLDRVVEELLDFARPVHPERRPSDANVIVSEAVSLVAEDASYRGVAIETHLGEGLPAVFVDPLQIRQALLNLLLNAIDAAGGSGTVTVATAVSAAQGAAPHVAVSVTDTGPGLGADEVGKLFEPFYTTKPNGTGLGLTIVSRILEQNGGHVGVSSVKGKGSTFTLRLPAADEETGGAGTAR